MYELLCWINTEFLRDWESDGQFGNRKKQKGFPRETWIRNQILKSFKERYLFTVISTLYIIQFPCHVISSYSDTIIFKLRWKQLPVPLFGSCYTIIINTALLLFNFVLFNFSIFPLQILFQLISAPPPRVYANMFYVLENFSLSQTVFLLSSCVFNLYKWYFIMYFVHWAYFQDLSMWVWLHLVQFMITSEHSNMHHHILSMDN